MQGLRYQLLIVYAGVKSQLSSVYAGVKGISY